jgi:hypothetical protein
MQTFYAAPLGNGIEPPAQLGVGGRPGKQAASQRAVVKPCASDEDGPAAAIVDVVDSRRRILGKPGGRVNVSRLYNVDQVMWDSVALFERDLVRTDIESPIHSGGITADDFAAMPPRELNAESALA